MPPSVRTPSTSVSTTLIFLARCLTEFVNFNFYLNFIIFQYSCLNMDNLFSVKDSVILITGGGRGIGEKFACEFAKRGAIVYAFDKIFSKNYLTENNQIKKISCNLLDTKKFTNSCNIIFNKHKKIDVLINNVGITFPSKEKFYSQKKWNETINVNLTTAFSCSQVVIKNMIKKNKGSIINITSINAELGFPSNPAYVASKGGLKQLGKALARDWGKFGIRVNNLGPGYIITDMTKKSYSVKKTRKLRENQTMLKRWGTVDDLVGPCLFLASDASSYVTGQDIYVDGGWISNGLPDL